MNNLVRKKGRIICCGTVLIDCIVTRAGSADVADDISIAPGGEGFNGATALARLGEDVTLAAAVGNDFAGKAVKSLIESDGIKILSGFDGKTPVSLLTVDDHGERKSRVSLAHQYPGYKPGLPEDLSGVSFVTMASLFRPPFLDPRMALEFARTVQSSDALLLADTKLPRGTDPQLKDYAETLQLIDIITPNKEEALHYTGANTPEEAAAVFRSYGVKNVIVKLGDQGCYVLPEEGDSFTCPAFQVTCVDGIGAGDTFNAGLIHALNTGASLREAVRYASACAAICVTGRGATSALKSEAQVMELLRQSV